MNQLLREAYRLRGRELPADLMLDDQRVRTAAGPGKWARAAAKGGFPTSVVKHLQQLWASQQPHSYKLRMTIECMFKLLINYPRRVLSSQAIAIPNFDHWHQGYQQHQQTSQPQRKAA